MHKQNPKGWKKTNGLNLKVSSFKNHSKLCGAVCPVPSGGISGVIFNAWQVKFSFQNKDSGETENKQPREDDEEETVKHK